MNYGPFADRLFLLLEEAAKEQGCDLSVGRDVAMAPLFSFRSGGRAAVTVSPPDPDSFVRLLRAVRKSGHPYRILGNGTNQLPPDNGFPGVLFLTGRMRKMEKDGTYIVAECGTLLNELILFGAANGLGGMEALYGIPGSVGGAVRMNAGAHGAETGAFLSSADILDVESGRVFSAPAASLGLSYRHSLFMERTNYILLRARFSLCPEPVQQIRAGIAEVTRIRCASQPLAYPSAGSVFRRPPEGEAWRFIDRCGLRGFRIGGAQISEKHAGFIVNRGGAHTGDVYALAEFCRRRVYEQCGVRLYREIEFFDDRGQTLP